MAADTLTRIREIISRVIDAPRSSEHIPETATLICDLGLDSLDLVELAMDCEDEFDLVADAIENELDATTTVADLVRIIDERRGAVPRARLAAERKLI